MGDCSRNADEKGEGDDGMRRAILLVMVMVAAMLVAFGGVALAQSTEQPDPDKGDRASDARSNADDTDNRGSPRRKMPTDREPVGKQERTDQQAPTQEVPEQEATTETTSEPRANGAWIQDVWPDPTTKITEFTNMVGTAPHVIMYYQNWEQADKKYFNPAKMDAAVNNGAMPVVTWAPRDPTLGKKQPKYALKTIIAGNHDAYIRQWARDAAAWGKPMYLRFAQEMNGTWYPWSPGVNGNTASEFRSAWKRVHNIFQQEGATNVRWVWSPYINCSGCSSFSSVYPGDTYVNWVALDGYNWGTTFSWSWWQSMAQVFGSSYDAVTKLAPSKPFMIAEVSSAEKGGSKASWIRNAFNTDIPNRMPKTQAVIWFSADKTTAGETDWRVNSSDTSLEAYKEVAALASYQGQLP